MPNSIVRITKITLQNFKNVVSGTIDLRGDADMNKASVLGVYGPNGSGKTTVIDAVHILRYALCGKKIPAEDADYINANAETARLTFDFAVQNSCGKYHASYAFSLCLEAAEEQPSVYENMENRGEQRIRIFDEELRCSFESDTAKTRMATLIDASIDPTFGPRSQYKLLVGTDKKTASEVMIAKRMTAMTSISFIFSKEMLEVLGRTGQQKSDVDDAARYIALINDLVSYGRSELLIVNPSDRIPECGLRPLVFRYAEENTVVLVRLDAHTIIHAGAGDIVRKGVADLNKVLQQLMPGLSLHVNSHGRTLRQNGTEGEQIELATLRNGVTIPLKRETVGIKKLVSMLQLLITIYNDPSVTVAIDNADAFIDEHLLGEILRVIADRGHGQLFFTSHDLRPLETLGEKSAVFTTVDPEKRYMRLSIGKDSASLRDTYYRRLLSKNSTEVLADPIHNDEIAAALAEAASTTV